MQVFWSFPSKARVVTKVFLFFTWHLEKVAISLGSLYPDFDFFGHAISFSRGQGEADVLDVALVGKMGRCSLAVLSATGGSRGRQQLLSSSDCTGDAKPKPYSCFWL